MAPAERASDPQAHLQHALDVSIHFLARRDRTVLEVRRHLEGKRIGPATIDAALKELQRQGHLDDARYARRFAEDRRALDSWGPDRIERRLLAAGVAPELVAAALADGDQESQLHAAVELLRRRFAQPPASDRDRDRALGVLVRKGYAADVAYDAIRAFERDG